METPSTIRELLDQELLAVLLDVDDTLIDSQGKTLNLALIRILQEAGITDLYLFTSMYGKQVTLDLDSNHSLYTREHLIEVLKDYGFNVIKIITPSDVILGRAGAYYEEKWKPVFEQWKDVDIFSSENVEKFQSDVAKIDADIKEHEREFHEEYERLFNAGKDEEAREYLKKNKTHKGDTFRIAKNDIKAKSYICIDDRQDELEKIKKENKTSPVLLTTIKVQTKEIDSPLGDLPGERESPLEYAKRKEEIKQRYRHKIIEHFNKLGGYEERIKKLEQGAESTEKLALLLVDFYKIKDMYGKLEPRRRPKHGDDIDALISKVNDILTTSPSSRDKLIRISTSLIDEYISLKDIYNHKGRSFLGKKKTFLEHINSSQTNHHYSRMIGLILNSHLIDKSLMEPGLMKEVSAIKIPKKDAYKDFSFLEDKPEIHKGYQSRL